MKPKEMDLGAGTHEALFSSAVTSECMPIFLAALGPAGKAGACNGHAPRSVFERGLAARAPKSHHLSHCPVRPVPKLERR